MNNRTFSRSHFFSLFAALFVAALTLIPATALAEVTFVRGQFTDRVDRGQPAGDAAAARSSGRITYWFVINNGGAATQVTVVWRINGNVARRQALDIGHTPRWRTWASHRAGRTSQVSVEILDAEGHSLHTETLPQ
ncbi:MAG: DUF2914 domain-containing protein [Polyangiales bacterium]